MESRGYVNEKFVHNLQTGCGYRQYALGCHCFLEGIGRLTGVATGALTQTNTYNALGGLKSEIKIIDSKSYTTNYEYDRQGNQILITNPDNSQIKYNYNPAGLIESVQRKESADSNFTDVVSNFDYSPTGAPTVIIYGNGVKTTNTYDADKLYRLIRKQTITPYVAPAPKAVEKKVSLQSPLQKLIAFVSFSPTIAEAATVSASKIKNSAVVTQVVATPIISIKGKNMLTTDPVSLSSATTGATIYYTINGSTPTSASTLYRGPFTLPAGNTSIKFIAMKNGYTNSPVISFVVLNVTRPQSQVVVVTPTPIKTPTPTPTPVPIPQTYGPNIQDTSYTYDAVGNITKITDTSDTNSKKTSVYAYDDLYRLLSATITENRDATKNYTESYTYSPVGNILTKTFNSVTTSYIYEGNLGASYANPHASTKIGTTILSYDKNGNLLSNGAQIYTWTYKNELASVSAGTRSFNYVYDALGQRIKVSSGAKFTNYPTKNYNVDDAGKIIKHIFAGDTSLATVEGSNANAKIYTAHQNNLNSTNVVIDSTGKVMEVSDYKPFGELVVNEKTDTFTEQRKYIGQEYDVDTSLSYLNARYYDGGRGQFISQDPMFWALPQELLFDPQQQDSYSYARNNPINGSDPSGKMTIKAMAQTFMNSVNSILGRSATNQSPALQAKNTPTNSSVGNSPTVLNSPVGSVPINSAFGSDRSNCSICSKIHGGTDYDVRIGTPVYATAPGTVDKAYKSVTYGNTIVVNHGPSSINHRNTVYTVYAHGDRLVAQQGQHVNTNDLIMYSGDTGLNLTGPHLHYEVISTSISLFGKGFSGNLNIRYGPDQLINLLSK